MIHVLFEEALYDERFVRDWTNAPFLVRVDTQQLLTERDLIPAGHPETFLVWDGRSGGTVSYCADHGYGQDDVSPALAGT
jgi:anaerobic selenocysteine-containing dehydrogenase